MQEAQSAIAIELVKVEDIDHRWALTVDLITASLRKAPASFSAGDAWTHCRSGSWFLLLAWKDGSIVGFTMWHFTGAGYFVCALLGGKAMNDWLPQTIELATVIAKDHGCAGIGGTCRPGLMKLLQDKYLPQARQARIQFVARI